MGGWYDAPRLRAAGVEYDDYDQLVDWDRTADLASITVPTLVMGATHDTMDPAHLEGMARSFPRGRYHHCPGGSHLAIYDDQASWFEGLLGFLRDVDSGAF